MKGITHCSDSSDSNHTHTLRTLEIPCEDHSDNNESCNVTSCHNHEDSPTTKTGPGTLASKKDHLHWVNTEIVGNPSYVPVITICPFKNNDNQHISPYTVHV